MNCRESLYSVAWTRSLSGERGYVGPFNDDRWQPVATLEEAEHLNRDEADDLVERLNGHRYIGAHFYTVFAS